MSVTPIPATLGERISEALEQSSRGGDIPEGFEVNVSQTADPKFGDYQTNAAMVLAKQVKTNPREFAAEIVGKLKLDDLCEEPTIAGPGFINFKLKAGVVAERLIDLAKDKRLGVPKVESPETIVIDFSAPNVAKPMHVGHIRSTIIGDCLARVTRFLGHKVITDNHIGDWGTQFGMIIYGWKNLLNEKALEEDAISELSSLYRSINKRIKVEELMEGAATRLTEYEAESDPHLILKRETELQEWAEDLGKQLRAVCEDSENKRIVELLEGSKKLTTECRQELVALQQGDSTNLEIWEKCVALSLDALEKIYSRLDIEFDQTLGESYYNEALKPLVDELMEKGIATESDGAMCVFSDGEASPEDDPFLVQKDGEWVKFPCMVQKSDGGFNYATTDLATIDHRVNEWKADQIWYVVGAPQQLHFSQVFAVAKRRGANVRMVHVAFGSILGKDKKPFKTRSGENIGLLEVLNEAIERSREFLDEREKEDDRFVLPKDEKPKVAEVIGISSVKYAELSQARMTDYVFDWDKMLSLKGNTAPYLMNSYVRTRGIFRKLDSEFSIPDELEISEDGERILAMKLLQFGETVPGVLDDFKPNVLAAYLYELAKTYHSFYEACPVLKSEGITRVSRLLLCHATSEVLKKGLELLGIEVIERM